MAGRRPVGCLHMALNANPSLTITRCFNPAEEGQTAQSVIVAATTWGVDYSFDATGNVHVMRSALECTHRGW